MAQQSNFRGRDHRGAGDVTRSGSVTSGDLRLSTPHPAINQFNINTGEYVAEPTGREFNRTMTTERRHTTEPIPEAGSGLDSDPTVTPAAPAVPAIREENPPGSDPKPPKSDRRSGSTRTLAGGTWVSLVVGALLLIILLAFILQNQNPVEMNIFTWSFQFPAGIGFLLCAVTGALIMAIVGGVRMFEYKRKIKKMEKVLS